MLDLRPVLPSDKASTVSIHAYVCHTEVEVEVYSKGNLVYVVYKNEIFGKP